MFSSSVFVRMDSFVHCAAQMLKELRILLQNTPIVLTTLRLVQLMALNIFAIDSTQQKGKCIICIATQ